MKTINFLRMMAGKGPLIKDESKVNAIAKILGEEIKPDMAGLQEIEDEEAFDRTRGGWVANPGDGVSATERRPERVESNSATGVSST